MMTLDHVGDREAMVDTQLGHQPLVRTTATSLEPRRGTLSCLSAQPPDLDFWTAAQPEVACVRLSIVPFLYSKRTAAARSPGSLYGRLNVLSPFLANQPDVELPVQVYTAVYTNVYTNVPGCIRLTTRYKVRLRGSRGVLPLSTVYYPLVRYSVVEVSKVVYFRLRWTTLS